MSLPVSTYARVIAFLQQEHPERIRTQDDAYAFMRECTAVSSEENVSNDKVCQIFLTSCVLSTPGVNEKYAEFRMRPNATAAAAATTTRVDEHSSGDDNDDEKNEVQNVTRRMQELQSPSANDDNDVTQALAAGGVKRKSSATNNDNDDDDEVEWVDSPPKKTINRSTVRDKAPRSTYPAVERMREPIATTRITSSTHTFPERYAAMKHNEQIIRKQEEERIRQREHSRRNNAAPSSPSLMQQSLDKYK